MNKLIIDRSKWRTGGIYGRHFEYPNVTGKGDIALLNGEGFMCCLGFFYKQRGLLEKEILTIGIPSDLETTEEIASLIPELVDLEEDDKGDRYYSSKSFTNKAVKINDNPDITAEDRELQIKNHFALNNIEVEFNGEYVKPEKNEQS